MKKTILTLIISAGMLAASQARTFTGVITDTMCGKDHAHMNVQPNEKCVRECVRSSKEHKYALLSDGKVYRLSDQKAPEKYAAKKVKVTGTLYEKTGIIKVDSIQPAE